MPTLLQVNVTANGGSHGRIAEDIGKLVISRGWNSVIAYGRWANPSQSKLIRTTSRLSIYEHGLESRLFDNHGLASRLATYSFIRSIKKIKPDIVHLHNIHGYYLNYPILFHFLNTSNIPVVWTLHDCWSFTGHCSHFVNAACRKWETGCFDCPLKNDYPKSYVDRSRRNYDLKKKLFCGNNNLHVVAVSDWLENLIKCSFFKEKDIHVIKNGVDLNVFRPTPQNGREKFLVLGVSNIWNNNKGLYDFYKLRKLLDEDTYEIKLVGLTKEQIAELPPGIVGVERTESVAELASIYSSAGVFANPTYADTFPTVNLEALACGTPLVTYKTGGSPEAIDSSTGYVVEQGDVEGFASAIKTIHIKGKSAFAKLCRERAEKMFDKTYTIASYLRLYESILQ